jgi:sulfotransferase family protein
VTLRVVGAGLGRTGTLSLKGALERLLGGSCYHMLEVMAHPEHVPLWHAAMRGEAPADWDVIFGDYSASVDWPSAAFWRELAAAYPDAVVVLSTRTSADEWWRSASSTIFDAMGRAPEATGVDQWHDMALDMLRLRFDERWQDEASAKAAYDRHNDRVRAEVPPGRLVEWRPQDGWEPLCAALGVPAPSDPFPHVNTTEEFRSMTGLDTAS